MPAFNLIPLHRDLVTHRVVKTGESPHATFVVVFDYPDGARTFDGKAWAAKPNDPTAKVTNTYTPG